MYWSVVVIKNVAWAEGGLGKLPRYAWLVTGGGEKRLKPMDWRVFEVNPSKDQKPAHLSRWDEEGQGSCKTKGKCFLIVFIIENGKWICGCMCESVSIAHVRATWPRHFSFSSSFSLYPRALLHLSSVFVCGLRSLFVGVDSAWVDSVGWFCLIIEGRSTHDMKGKHEWECVCEWDR